MCILKKWKQFLKIKPNKEKEIDQFKYSLPNTNLLLRSPNKYGLAKEIDKLNNNLADKLEQTLSEYGVEEKL